MKFSSNSIKPVNTSLVLIFTLFLIEIKENENLFPIKKLQTMKRANFKIRNKEKNPALESKFILNSLSKEKQKPEKCK